MYPEAMHESLRLVEKTRPQRLALAKTGKKVVTPMTLDEREDVLKRFHPDYKPDARKPIRIGRNRGESLTTEVVDLLESHSRIDPRMFDLSHVDLQTDILIIGGGGAGCMAAIWARREGAKSLIATKLRIGDANSMMSQGGMQAAVNPNDSPAIHYLDVVGGGHFDNKAELVRTLVSSAPMITEFLEELGVMWDKDADGRLHAKPGGGTSRRRMLSARDYTGAAIMRTLMDEVRNHPEDVTLLEFAPAVELLLDDKGHCAGAVLYNLETEEYMTVRAKATIIATGGYGRLHVRGFATTNHYGATADGLIMAYRAGAKLMHMDAVQYHPTGAVFPEQILGFLVTEEVRGLGAQPVNRDGELFVFPLEPRDVESAAFIRECEERKKGTDTPTGKVGIWLDSPIIDMLHGPGTTRKQLPAMFRQFTRFNIDIVKEPMLIYPTLHYQNGGVEIDERSETSIPGLFVAGEASGGVHGRNRLMGNSVLDYNVFGRIAGLNAASYVKKAQPGPPSLEHVDRYEQEMKKAGIETNRIAPILLPDYTRLETKERQLTTTYHGSLR